MQEWRERQNDIKKLLNQDESKHYCLSWQIMQLLRMQKTEVLLLFNHTDKLASLSNSVNRIWSLRYCILQQFQQFQNDIIEILTNLHKQRIENDERCKLETSQYLALKQNLQLEHIKCLQLEDNLRVSNERYRIEHEKCLKLENDLRLAMNNNK